MMNVGFTLLLLGLLAAALLWIAVVDIRTYTISDRLNLGIALLAPVYWWAAGVPLWPDAAMQVGVAILVFLFFAGAFYLNVMSRWWSANSPWPRRAIPSGFWPGSSRTRRRPR